MNNADRKWIKENLKKIFIEDTHNDSQIEDTMNFLADLAAKVGFNITGESDETV